MLWPKLKCGGYALALGLCLTVRADPALGHEFLLKPVDDAGRAQVEAQAAHVPSRLPARALSGLRMPLTSVPGAGMALYCHQSSSLASTRRGTFREILGIPWLVFPVFRTWHSHGWGLGSVPGWGTEILLSLFKKFKPKEIYKE